MPRILLIATAVLLAGVLSTPAWATPPVLFDGFGFGNFEESGSIAAELRRIEADAERERLVQMPEVAVAMQGPAGRNAPPVPLSAELRSHVARFDVAAGLVADSAMVADGPARWTGRIGLASDRDDGGESVELRTIIGNNAEWGLVGVELGPRVERRLRKGATFFIDGKAEARAMRSAETGWWSLPGTSTDGSSMVGVMARTGLVH
ncbi:MAG: hypothetical protein K8S94_06385 [Planctomycetia bacterium]|nr:hypothetical protein [Planctomycetia bacterium]